MSAGTGTATGALLLVRQNLRRDRVVVLVVLVLMAVMAYASAASTTTIYHSTADRVAAAEAINAQPALRALYGRILDIHALGEVAMTKMTVTYAAFAGALFIALVRRHTRTEEESGRAELVGAAAIGRDAPMAAAVLEASAVAAVLAAVVSAMCLLGGLPLLGSLWFGVIWLGTGLVATGIGAVACQLSASARSCAGIAAALMGALFVVRAVGDASSSIGWLVWLSPLGWNTQLRAWSGTRPWVAVLYLVASAVLLAAAQAMRSRRDLGSGPLAARPGRVDGRPSFANPYALVLRGQLVALTLWSTACLALGILFGLITPGLQDLLDTVDMQEVLDHLGGALIAAVVSVAGIAVTCFGITVTTHAADDETSGRVELALSTAASRGTWWRATAATALGGVAWLLLVTGVGLWVGLLLGGFEGDGGRSWTALVAALAWVPAAWVVLGVTLCCHAWSAHRAALGWAGLGLCVFLTLAGDLLHLPRLVIHLSPYSSVPAYPADAWRWLPFVVLTLVAALLAFGAWLRFERRDIG